MIDYFVIFTQGGLVLWSLATEEGVDYISVVNGLIHSVLLEQKSGAQTSYFHGSDHCVRWLLDNQYGIVLALVYRKMLSVGYLPDLLDLVRTKFCEDYKDQLQVLGKATTQPSFPEFEEQFQRIHLGLAELEARPAAPRSFAETNKGKNANQNDKKKKKKKKGKKKGNQSESEGEEEEDVQLESDLAASQEEDSPSSSTPERTPGLPPSLRGRGRGRGRGRTRGGRAGKSGVKETVVVKEKEKGKKKRSWAINDAPSNEDMACLDYSKKRGGDSKGESSTYKNLKFNLDDDEDLTSNVQEMLQKEGEKKEAQQQAPGFFSRFLPNLSDRPVTIAELEEPLANFRQHLVDKNVASDVADNICESVGKNLEGKNLPSFSRVKTLVSEALTETVTHILTPKRSIDVLAGVEKAKKEGRPFVMTFVGVNGVGKSTSLAKVTSWLQSNGHRVLIAACDTFRSGAVEQLRTHARRLDTELYERGYGKDAADIARNAIKYAKDKRCADVILVDTAGRMQDNRPLMRALGKLVQVNKPDLVIFVGEALVGNDGVDQLVKFNSSLAAVMQEDSPTTATKENVIDGIFLTKFDTIDDKVGAAISMVYTTGQPILFLGTGQQYTDLKKMNVNTVVKALLR